MVVVAVVGSEVATKHNSSTSTMFKIRSLNASELKKLSKHSLPKQELDIFKFQKICVASASVCFLAVVSFFFLVGAPLLLLLLLITVAVFITVMVVTVSHY